jgi:hypothetical protein
VTVMSNASHSIKISIIVFRTSNFTGRIFSVIDAIFGTMLVDKLRPERGNRARALQAQLNSVLDPDVHADMRQPSTSTKRACSC